MGRYDFDFGYNLPHANKAAEDAPSYQPPESPPERCMGRVVCERCGKFHGYCVEVREQLTGVKVDPGVYLNPGTSYEDWTQGANEPMDLSKDVSGKERKKFENREWIDSQTDLPKKGAATWKVDAFREAKKKTKGIVGFVDLSLGKVKRVMSLRKGFTLDAFVDELGANTDKWPGKTISLERGGSEGQYVNVSE